MYAYLVGEDDRSGGVKKALMALALLTVAVIAMVAMASPAQAADLIVTSNADSGTGTLRAAVEAANDNGEVDTITFNLQEGDRTITLTSQITFSATQQTTIEGGEAGVTVSSGGTSRVLEVSSGAQVDLKNLTVANGRDYQGIGGGGGIYNDPGGTLNVSNSTFSGDSATSGFGGGVFNIEGLTTINSTTITNNSAPEGGGAGVASWGDTQTSTVVGNSIIADNSFSDVDYVVDFDEESTNSFTSEGYNLIGDGNATGAFTATRNDQVIGDTPRPRPARQQRRTHPDPRPARGQPGD